MTEGPQTEVRHLKALRHKHLERRGGSSLSSADASRRGVKARVAVVLAIGFAAVLAELTIAMSKPAPRTAGSNFHAPVAFVAKVPPRGELCQPSLPVPADAGRALILIGTYGQPVPPGRLLFLSSSGSLSAAGDLPSGAREGTISIPITQLRGAAPAGQVCIRLMSKTPVALGGEGFPAGPGSESIDGKPAPGIVSLVYERRGRESDWQLFPSLVKRFGLGKAAFFGDWTLPACIVLTIAAWAGTARLLIREST